MKISGDIKNILKKPFSITPKKHKGKPKSFKKKSHSENRTIINDFNNWNYSETVFMTRWKLRLNFH